VEIRRRMQQIEQAGLTVDRYLADRNVSQQQWVGELSVMGMLESRVEILLNSIATKEDLLPQDAEIEELLAVEAKNRGISLATLRQTIEKEGSESLIRYALLRAKVMDFLFDNAQVEFVPPGTLIEEEAPALPEGEATPELEEKKPKAKAKAKKAEEVGEAAPAKPAAKKAKEVKEEAAADATEEKPKPKRAPKKKAESE
jgi:outer membrane biosynthesis protein TonB